MDTLLQTLIGLGRHWVVQRWAQCRQELAHTLAQERQRLFDALLLLGLGLIFSAMGALGLLLWLWWCTPVAWRPAVMGLVLVSTGVAGVVLLAAARRRLARGSDPAGAANRGPSP